MSTERDPAIPAPSSVPSLDPVRANQEIAAIKDDSLKGHHALEIKITKLQATVDHLASRDKENAELSKKLAKLEERVSSLATREDLEKAKTWYVTLRNGGLIALASALGSLAVFLLTRLVT